MLYQIAVYRRPTDPKDMYKDRFRAARELGFRSGLEVQLAQQLDDNKIPYEYEGTTLEYDVPADVKRYTPDFILPNFIVIEGKGEFTSADRKKIAFIKDQHPDIDLRFVFSNSRNRIGKKSKTTYGMWCRHQGIPYADKWIPAEWWREPTNERSKAAIEAARNAR